MSRAAEALRRLRGSPAVNRVATSGLRAALRGRVPDWAVLHLPRSGVVTVTPPGGRPVRLRSGDDWITSRLWWLGLEGFEPEALTPFLRLAREARVVLDIGAYVGHYALLAAAVNPAARVFAFEPVPRVAARLGHNLALNPDLTVTLLPYAVGRVTGQARFHVGAAGLPSSSSLQPAWEGMHESIDVATVTLDDFAERWGVADRVDLVKIDVEQGEPNVVAGMGGLLARSRPVIVAEALPGRGSEARYGAMSETLSAAGYDLFHLTGDGPVAEPALTLPEPGSPGAAWANHLACPRERVPPWLGAPA